MRRAGKTHEEHREEQIALGVAPSLGWVASFLDTVDGSDDDRKYRRQHNHSQGPPTTEADEAETLAASKHSEEQAPHVHNRPNGIHNCFKRRRVLKRQHVT